MSINFPNIITHRKFINLTSALTATEIYERAVGAPDTLIRADIYIEQASGSAGSVSATLTYYNGITLNLTSTTSDCTGPSAPAALSIPLHMNGDSAIKLSTTIDSGTPTYSVHVALTNLADE